MTSTNDFLHASQLEDYQASFTGSGFSFDEFELTQQRRETTGALYDPQAGTVIVRCKSTGLQKIYELSSGNNWPIDFSDDLHNGFFRKEG